MKILKSNEFNEAVKKGTVLVDFYADWCGPCKMMGPVIEQVAQEYDGKASFYKLNVDESPDIAQQFGVMSIPTLIVFRDGKKVAQEVGYQPKPAVEKLLGSYLG